MRFGRMSALVAHSWMVAAAMRGLVVVVLPLGLALSACGGTRRPMKLELANRPAAGRPATCPEGAVDVFGDGTPSPMDARCSYDDAYGEGLSRVRGKVVGEGAPGGLPVPLAGVHLTVHRMESGQLGGPVAKATTDAQGSFTFSAFMPAGEYALVVEGGAQRTLSLGGAGARVVDDIVVVVPADPRWAADAP